MTDSGSLNGKTRRRKTVLDNRAKNELDALIDLAVKVYEERIPFNRVLGLQVETVTVDQAVLGFDMRDDLIGNYKLQILHGGVISAVLDTSGGMMASISVLNAMAGASREEMAKRLTRIGTIDLRIDYLRPGRGDRFYARSNLMRTGRKVSVTRMELHNNEGLLIAVGTGTYIVG